MQEDLIKNIYNLIKKGHFLKSDFVKKLDISEVTATKYLKELVIRKKIKKFTNRFDNIHCWYAYKYQLKIIEKEVRGVCLEREFKKNILDLLGKSVMCVKDITTALNSNAPRVSRYLIFLNKIGKIKKKNVGKFSYYYLYDKQFDNFIKSSAYIIARR